MKTPLQTLLDEREKSLSEKFNWKEIFGKNSTAQKEVIAHDQESILKGVRLGLAMGREEIDNLKFHPKWDAEPIKRVLTAALEAKEKELGV